MDDDKAKQLDRVDKKVGEIHNYARHTMQMLIVWYTFFVTVNFLSMGLLAKDIDFTKTSKVLLFLLTIIFASQNILGIIAFHLVKKKLNQASADITRYEDYAALLTSDKVRQLPSDKSMPVDLYSTVIWMMMVTLALILSAWIAFPFLL